MDVYFTRAISDHFILFTPCDMDVDPETSVLKTNQEFLRQMKEKYPDMDMISFGPTLRGVHSPDEKVNTKTVEMWWRHLVDILQHIDVLNQ